MGNGQGEEPLLASLGGRLRRLLPSDWTVTVAGAAPDAPEDATATLIGPRGVAGELAVVVKRWTTAPSSAVAGILAHTQARTSKPTLLVTDYTNRPLRQACEDLGINYIDESGWALVRLDEPPVYIRTQGTGRPAPRLANEVTRLNGVAVGRILRTLLEIQPPIGVRDLATRASVKSPGSVSKLLPTLVSAGAVERDENGQIVAIKRGTLLHRWTQDYTFLTGNSVVIDYLAPRGLDPVLERVSAQPDVCVTGGFAANEYLGPGTVPVVPATRLSLYASEPGDVAGQLGLLRVDRQSSNVIMAVPRDLQLVKSPKQHRGRLPLAPLPQVLADLLTLPGRESTLADQLIDQLAKTDPTWREQ